MKRKRINLSFVFLLVALVFYFVGAIFIPPDKIEYLKHDGYAEQEKYTYTDDDGEEHEDLSLIKIDGLGKIFTYKDIYFMSIPMFVIAMVFGALVFGKGIETDSVESLRHIIFANCVLGVLLIRLTTKDCAWATAFFWIGIIAAFIATSSKIE